MTEKEQGFTIDKERKIIKLHGVEPAKARVVIANPADKPNRGGTGADSPKKSGIRSVKGRQAEAFLTETVATVVKTLTTTTKDEDKEEIRIKSK